MCRDTSSSAPAAPQTSQPPPACPDKPAACRAGGAPQHMQVPGRSRVRFVWTPLESPWQAPCCTRLQRRWEPARRARRRRWPPGPACARPAAARWPRPQPQRPRRRARPSGPPAGVRRARVRTLVNQALRVTTPASVQRAQPGDCPCPCRARLSARAALRLARPKRRGMPRMGPSPHLDRGQPNGGGAALGGRLRHCRAHRAAQLLRCVFQRAQPRAPGPRAQPLQLRLRGATDPRFGAACIDVGLSLNHDIDPVARPRTPRPAAPAPAGAAPAHALEARPGHL